MLVDFGLYLGEFAGSVGCWLWRVGAVAPLAFLIVQRPPYIHPVAVFLGAVGLKDEAGKLGDALEQVVCESVVHVVVDCVVKKLFRFHWRENLGFSFAADGWGGWGNSGGELGGFGDCRVNIGDKYAPRLFFRYKMVKPGDVF